MNSYQDAIKLLTSKGRFCINLGFDRINKAIEVLNIKTNFDFIHVAGTNGKGSVCSILNEILIHNNKKVGLYTSPHIFEYTERIRVNNNQISKEDFARLLFEIVNKTADIHLTEFEILTLISFMYFAEKRVDIVVLETGLGGRFDATNVIEKTLCSVITNIDLDHTDRLGDSIEKIAFEKAGIIKSGCPVIISPQNKGLDVIKKIAKEKKSELILAEQKEMECSLKGTYQKQNISLALEVCKYLNIPEEVIKKSLLLVKNPCRFEYLKDYDILVDVAHNPDGIRALRKSLDFYFPNKNFQFIFGCLKTKDCKEMLENLLKVGDELYIFEFSHPNARSFDEVKMLTNFDAKPFSEYKKEKMTVICGSFYMLKELFEKIGIKYNVSNDLRQ